MASITIEAITKTFGAVPVLHDIDLSIGDGEFVVLVGPSGCGKSTLLRMIAGLEDITAGEIRIDDRRINEVAPKDRDIAMVFQSYALYPHMTVADNMSYSLKLRKTATERIAEAVGAAAGKLGLDPLLARRPKALSGGQRQRVAMGRAIVRHPKAFLFDEPLSNLDARLREQMRAEIKRLHKSIGATSVYVTHDQIEAMTLADRIVAMHGGIIQQVGNPLDLYDRPANLFVAGFIGSPAMNLVEGHCRAGVIETDDGSMVAIPAGIHLTEGQAVTIGIRPEHVRIVSDSEAGSYTARVDLVEPTGFGTIVHVRLLGQDLKIYTLERGVAAVGQPLHIALDDNRLHIFDRETTNRVGK